MPRSRKLTPSYVHHKATGRGRAVWYDSAGVRQQKLLPGAYESKESREAFAKLILMIEASPLRSPAAEREDVSVAEILLAFLAWAERYYVDAAGDPTSEQVSIRRSIKPVRELFGVTPAATFGPKALTIVRQRLIQEGLSRTGINHHIDRVKRVFKWAAAEELVPVTTYQALKTLSGLRRGRTEARETEAVRPVSDELVNATLPYLPPHVRVMLELMRYTGMRPQEVCSMTLSQIDRTGKTWSYSPPQHKTAHRGRTRVIHLGPRAQAVISAFLAPFALDPDSPIFSPRQAQVERFAAMRTNRKSKVQPSQTCRKRTAPKRVPADRYTHRALDHAVGMAIRKAYPPPGSLARRSGESRRAWWGGKVDGTYVPGRLTEEQKQEVKRWWKKHHWHPYQLRHAVATLARKELGLEAAGAALGHSKMSATEIYAERDSELAIQVATKIG